MKTKIFKIRLSEEFIYDDQKRLDHFLQENNILKYETAFVKEEENYWSVILYYEELKVQFNEPKNEKYSAEQEQLNSDEIKILDSLKLWRSEKAKEKSLPVYFIATNKELLSIAKYKPIKKEELLDIKGFGKFKIENYGGEIIQILETV
ncbi:MAG TPA: HRDC domain-containing protein [Kaistella chaponensis]|jgi:ribonuclease D|uniref:HRDC domain-containing protein n=1 Tax=Kaistella chaponensis TaxID=713588 RepID=UPI002CF59EDA|nr:HRDC domain-containing protein [Kaistella chaponensis]HPW88198.1 HRDC domain-containing protein [Kaistella chaponensis]HQC06407.1 HRDC domain-containing protein [Kaistella chaponensis]